MGMWGFSTSSRLKENGSHTAWNCRTGRCPTWDDASGLAQLSLAYCLTVHKSQGSEYDTILLPIAKGMDGMLSRNLLYTAISRAKKRVILYGDPQALDVAVQKNLPQRKSLLVPKTRMLLECA